MALLQTTMLCKNFGGVAVADQITLALEPGMVVGLVGPNGAGKTSLFNLIAGALRPDSGSIVLEGQRIDRLTMHARARLGISRTWQSARLFPSLSVFENLLLGARRHMVEEPFLAWGSKARLARAGHEAAMVLLERLGLADLADRAPGELSYGKQKLVSLARALMNDGQCLLLDEPMAGVEGPAYETMHRVIRGEARRGRAICIVEHNISFMEDLCDVALFMFNGRIVSRGTVVEMKQDPALTALYFGS